MPKAPGDETIQAALDSMSGNVWVAIRSSGAVSCRPCPRGWRPEDWASSGGHELLISGTEEEVRAFVRDVVQVLGS